MILQRMNAAIWAHRYTLLAHWLGVVIGVICGIIAASLLMQIFLFSVRMPIRHDSLFDIISH